MQHAPQGGDVLHYVSNRACRCRPRRTENRLQGLKAAVPQDEPRGELVTAVVEVEVVELCFGHGVLEVRR